MSGRVDTYFVREIYCEGKEYKITPEEYRLFVEQSQSSV